MLSLIEARLLLEPGIAGLAAQRGTAEQREELERMIHPEQEHIRQTRAVHGARHRAPQPDLKMAGNPFVARIMEGLGHFARSSRGLTNSVPEMREVAHADHERIVAAVVAQDDEAASRDEAHLKHVAETLEREGEV